MAGRTLSEPEEPTEEVLKEHAEAYNRGLSDPLGIDSLGDSLLIKQGMIGYLAEEWNQEIISYQEIQEACGDANSRIERWYDGEESWDGVLQRLEHSLHLDFE